MTFLAGLRRKCEDALEVIASLKLEAAYLEGENEKLQATVVYKTSYRDGIDDLASVVRDLRVVCAEMEARSVASITNSQAKEFEGDTVRSPLLKMLEISHSNCPTMYARELLRQLFEPGELAGTSITGKKSNAHKEKAVEPQLYPIRVNGVVKHTCKKFALLKERPVRAFLSSMLNKEKAAPLMDM